MTRRIYRSKARNMANYRIYKVFESIPEIMGLQLERHGEKWDGPYYINGDRHPYRTDKLNVVKWKGDIWVFEQGGEGMSLPTWLQRYGGAADYWDAVKIIEGNHRPFVWSGSVRHKEVAVRYVAPEALRGAKGYDLKGCALFRWMCGLFPEAEVREAWERYNVTTDSHGNCVYWYVDRAGRILFDKRILYKEDGHRDKNFFPGRQYRVGDGYTAKCYFGANTLTGDEEHIFICESEKSALLFYLMYKKPCLATGGKGNLREIDEKMLLLPDKDAIEEWSGKGEVCPWWQRWGIPFEEIPRTADIGDMVEYERLRLQQVAADGGRRDAGSPAGMVERGPDGR